MKNLSGFKRAYLIFLCVCISISVVFLIYVYFVIQEFDNAQPERVVEKQIQWLSERAKDGTLADELNFDELCSNRYENNNASDFGEKYNDKINGAELTYEFIAAQSGDLFKSYSILADGSPVGTLALLGENSRTKLFFFSMADWSKESFDAIPSDTVYNLTVYRPENTEVYINGISPADNELNGSYEIPSYSIKGLLKEPVIEYLSADGSEIPYFTENNVIKPAVYSYQLSVPNGIRVSLNGSTINGTESGRKVNYSIREMVQPDITFTDGCGATLDYAGGDLSFFAYDVTVPEDCTLTVSDTNADVFCSAQYIPHPDAQAMLTHANVQLPSLKSYSFTLLSENPQVVISGEGGAKSEYTLSEPKLEITSFGGSDTIPEDISSQLDIMEIAMNWSRFMTDDLTGEQHGLSTVQEYLIKDSDYYRYAYEWANGGDIKFTSPHTLDSFTNESLTDFVRYSENCFSCKVYFEKNMSLIYEDRFAGFRTDTFHSIIYFVYVDDTPDNGKDDPHWAIAVMHDVL